LYKNIKKREVLSESKARQAKLSGLYLKPTKSGKKRSFFPLFLYLFAFV